MVFLDADGDGYGDPSSKTTACSVTEGYTDRGKDCDDTRAEVNPEGREVCNGWDDDCDGQIDDDDPDVDMATATTWYEDKDGDGWGSATGATARSCSQPPGFADNADDCNDNEASVEPTSYWKDGDGDGFGNPDEQVNTCDQPPQDYVDKPGDCDDLDALTFPGAQELCDDKDTDCDGNADDSGLASFDDLSTWTDVSADLNGAQGDPAEWISQEKGVLHICAGTWFATLELRHNVDVVGHDAPVLDAGLVRSVIYLEDGGLDVELRDLELTGGEADGAALGLSNYPAGGGVFCRGASTMVLDGVRIQANQGYIGGGLYVEECEVSLVDSSVVLNNTIWSGAGIAVTGGSLELQDSEIFRNDAGNNGGGLYVGDNSSEPQVTLTDSLVHENSAALLGGGASVYLATLDCTAGTGDFGFFSNTAGEDGGAVHFYEDATLVSKGCDWGTGSEDNTPNDLSADSGSFGDDENFTCTTDGGCN